VSSYLVTSSALNKDRQGVCTLQLVVAIFDAGGISGATPPA
jgi:hypothetical protein